jgi:uncharacterized protein (TIGR03437 family)
VPRVLVLGLLAGLAVFGQQAGPALAIDAGADVHSISPDIYGISFYWNVAAGSDPTLAADIRATARRWGGNSTSTYHWQYQVSNLDSDWFYEVLPGNNQTFNAFADQVRTTGGAMVGTIPVLGWLPKANVQSCSFDVAKYGKQCKQDPYAQYHPLTCGNGVVYDPACGDPSVPDGKGPANPVNVKNNDPTDSYAPFDETFQAQWIQSLLARYGQGNQGGVSIWSLDNEPIWWDSTHRDIHPNPYTYDEVLGVDVQYAQAIKQADPTALVSGPVADNWASLWFSKTDIVAGWSSPSGNYWGNPVDRNAHGGVPFMSWYLQQLQNYERTHGSRLVDYLDLHAYIEPSAIDTGTDSNGNTLPESAATQALRLDSTREFWDPAYIVNNDYWIRDVDNNGAPIAPSLIPRLRAMVSQNYPGTKIAITEYNWRALDTLNGGLAQADLLGIFGREGLDMAMLWGPPKPTDPGAFAFKMYRNFDGIGGAFGETGVQASSADQSQLSIYGALSSSLNLTAVVINKTSSDLSSSLNLANFNAGAAAKVWLYSGANLAAIVAQPDVALNGGSLTAVFPANSITMLVIPPATLPAPKPVVQAVTNAASYATSIAPGQMVVVWGSNLGPTSLTHLTVDANGLVSSNVSGVRILFDGIPGPVVYVSATQCSAVVPYFGAIKATTHVQVEYQGVRSDAVEIAISPTAPGLFTVDSSGAGPGAILNQDGVTLNSAAAPAGAGSVVILYGTGEGLTDPPGVDGRPALSVLPKPLANVSVNIGGLPASVEYAGAAPGNMPGLFQINARIAANVQPGNQVPVRVTVGSLTSQDGVTLAVH